MAITVVYRDHGGFWEATSSDVPQLAAGDADLSVLRTIVRQAISDYLGNDEIELTELLEPLPVSRVAG
jgi:hypothetical protein